MTSRTISHVFRFLAGYGGWPYGAWGYGPGADGVVIGSSFSGEAD